MRMNETTKIEPATRVSSRVSPADASQQRLLGLFEGTKIATGNGWQAVETLKAGDTVWTFDDGLQPVLDIKHRRLWSEPAEAQRLVPPLLVPAGALANEDDIFVMPSQGLLLECENASDKLGDPYAVVPMLALMGLCGIRAQVPENGLELFLLRFGEEQAVYIDGGLLFHVPVFNVTTSGTAQNASKRYDVKTIKQTKELLTDLDLAELALREPYEDFFGATSVASTG
jgi:hypothetical protein